MWKYFGSCEMYHRIKALRHARYGPNMKLPPPSHPWKQLTMEYVTDWPESTASEYTGMLVVIKCLTDMVPYLVHREDIDSPEPAQLIFKHVNCQ